MANPAKLIATLILALVAAAGCTVSTSSPIPGSGVLALQERELKEFDEIEIRCSATVVVKIGELQSVLVQTDDNLIDLVETRVSRDTLRIDCDENLAPVNDVTVTITVARLKDLTIRGSAEVTVTELFEPEFDLEIRGSGHVAIEGIAHQVEAKISGSGSLDLVKLIAQDVELSITGRGDAHVYAEEELDVRITGTGDVVYSGNPAHIERRITGSGNIRESD
ncbi:MAG: DUF2807 domain-containing protein [Pirellulales bacterium]|nr:DUF2807 domain-containing protein [Pirellulales bacterium]